MVLAGNIHTASAESVCRRTAGMVCRLFRADRAFIRSFAVPRRPQNEYSNQSWHERGNAAQRPETMIGQLARWLRMALDAISLLGSFIFVACVEVIRVKRMAGGR